MAESKRIQAAPLPTPPDTIQLTLTIEEAAHVMAIIGRVQAGGITTSVFHRLSDVLKESEEIHFRKHYKIPNDENIQRLK